jgi:hypothetical protein
MLLRKWIEMEKPPLPQNALTLTAMLLTSLLSGCAHKNTVTQMPPPPPPAIQAHKPKPRPIEAGDMVFHRAEVLPNGVIVCHRPAQMIDVNKKTELVATYQCR